jgi:hypothetical protein
MERTYRLIELAQRANKQVNGLLAQAPQLENMRLRRKTTLDVAVFQVFGEQTKRYQGSSPWDVCRGDLAEVE